MKTLSNILNIAIISSIFATCSQANTLQHTRQPRTLNILLTNDDGYHTEEIQTLK